MEFIPLLGELLLGCRPAADGGGAFLHVRPGQPLLLPVDRDALAADVTLTREQAAVGPISRHAGGAGIAFASPPAEEPGLYAWAIAGEPAGFGVVDFPAEESDLRSRPAPELAGGSWTTLDGGRRLRDLREGTPLWPWLLGLALLAGLMETAAAWWAVK